MSCVICKYGTTKAGFTSLPLERDGSVFVIQNVPADVCDTCGEGYMDSAVAEAVFALAEELRRKGVQFAVTKYAA